MATDHSTINQFPSFRWVQLQATGTNVEAVTLPTALSSLRVSILASKQSDGTTDNACQISTDQSLADGDALPAIAEGVDRVDVPSGQRLEDISFPDNGALAPTKLYIAGANSGLVCVGYDVASGAEGI